MVDAHGVAVADSGQRLETSESLALMAPKRRTIMQPPAAPPSLPDGADRVAPLTMEIVVRRETKARTPRTLRQTVSRTSDRIHVSGSDRRDCLFERNPIDPHRVSAALIDHRSKAIVLYAESDLRMALGIRGWADVLALGFDAAVMSGYKQTKGSRAIAGIRFTRFVAGRDSSDEVWWSDEQAFPSSFTLAEGNVVTRFAVQHVRPRVDAGVLRPAESRFSAYRLFDLSNWMERQTLRPNGTNPCRAWLDREGTPCSVLVFGFNFVR